MSPRYRRVAVGVGVAALAAGVSLLAGAGGGVSGFTVVLYAAGGVLGAAMVYLLYRDWPLIADIDPPDVENAIEHPPPGTSFDRRLAQFDGSGGGYLPDRSSIHDRLCDLAATLLAREEGYTHEEALAVVEAGEWPDDSRVGDFLRDPDIQLPRSWGDRLRGFVAEEEGPSDFQALVGRTVDVLARRSESVELDADADDSTVMVPAVGNDATTTRRQDGRRATDGGEPAPGPRATGRWRIAVPVALGLVGFGFVLREATIVLTGVVPLGFTVYARAFAAPSGEIAIERSADPEHPAPDEEVAITTTIHNRGDRTVADLRVIDGVPSGLSVTEGSPRLGTTLGPGESTSLTYSVRASRGVHEFGPAYTISREYAGASATVRRMPAVESATATLTCVPPLGDLPLPVPLHEQSGEYLGRIPAAGGEGVEFHATREYRPGDPMARIDWKRLARSADDDLTTVQFREQRAATVALVIDTFASAYRAPAPSAPSGVERSVAAAGRLFGSLLDTGDRVGIAARGPKPGWLTPGTGIEHRTRAEEFLATDDALGPTAPEEEGISAYWVREFHRRFPAETQVLLLSALCDRRYDWMLRRLQAYGHPVTIVSPDPTADASVGQRLVRVERRLRIERLRERGVRVVDWHPDDDLAVALERAGERWSA